MGLKTKSPIKGTETSKHGIPVEEVYDE